MILLDANVLIYLYNADAPQHSRVAVWFEEALAKNRIGVPLPAVWAFVRITTNPAWSNPLSPEVAFRLVTELLRMPGVNLIVPGPRHLEILAELAARFRITGPRITDAALAAMAIENDAALASADRDFQRFTGLRWIDPLAAK